MAKFLIAATPSVYNENTEMVMTMVMQPIYHEFYEGSLDDACAKMREIREFLISSRNFDKNCGFSLSANIYPLSQRKPNGYDKRRKDRSANYINHQGV